MNRVLGNFFVAAASLAFITACGGGSDGGGLTAGAPTAEPATITAENAPAIAGTVAEVAMGQGAFSSFFTPTIPIGSIGVDAAVAPVMKPVFSATVKTANPSQLYATTSSREPCAVSGSVDVVIKVSNPEQPSVNDSFDFQFMGCDDGSGVVLDGGMAITVASVDGDFASGNILLGMRIEFSEFSVTEGGETTTANGTISIDIDSRDPTVTTITVATSALVTTSAGTEEVLSNFTIQVTEDASMFPVAVTVETSFTISSPRIGGSVSVTTSLALNSTGSDYPFEGELRITGAGGAVIVLIALDANTVRLQIDIDGDGAEDETLDMTWDELMAAAG